MNTPLPEEMLALIKDSLFRGRKIDAIKFYRDCTGAGLADAKAAVERLEAELRAVSPEKFATVTSSRGEALPRWVGWMFLIWGILFGLAWLDRGVSSLTLLFGSARTEGTVIELREIRDKGAPSPVVRYQVGGIKYRYTGVGTDLPLYTVDDKVWVVYKINQPEAARIDSFFDRWFEPLWFFGGGIFFAVWGIYILKRTGSRTLSNGGDNGTDDEGSRHRPTESRAADCSGFGDLGELRR